jgi:hypothetical protein
VVSLLNKVEEDKDFAEVLLTTADMFLFAYLYFAYTHTVFMTLRAFLNRYIVSWVSLPTPKKSELVYALHKLQRALLSRAFCLCTQGGPRTLKITRGR